MLKNKTHVLGDSQLRGKGAAATAGGLTGAFPPQSCLNLGGLGSNEMVQRSFCIHALELLDHSLEDFAWMRDLYIGIVWGANTLLAWMEFRS